MQIYDSMIIDDLYIVLDTDIMGGTMPVLNIITITTADYTPTGTDVVAGDIVVLSGDNLGHVDMSGLYETEDGSITVRLKGGITQFTPKSGVTVLEGAGGGVTSLIIDGQSSGAMILG